MIAVVDRRGLFFRVRIVRTLQNNHPSLNGGEGVFVLSPAVPPRQTKLKYALPLHAVAKTPLAMQKHKKNSKTTEVATFFRFCGGYQLNGHMGPFFIPVRRAAEKTPRNQPPGDCTTPRPHTRAHTPLRRAQKLPI
jgi:hypothetical protein